MIRLRLWDGVAIGLATVLTAAAAQQTPPSGAAAKQASAQAAASAAAAPREAHGDWGVGCSTPPPGQVGNKVCTAVQEQFDSQSKQRVVAIELQPDAAGAKGPLILPFGLDVQKDVTLQVDDAKPFSTTRVTTCVPVGCVVLVNMDAATLAQLGKGKLLKVSAGSGNDKRVSFDFSLKGFEEAFKRARVLGQQK